MKTISDLKVKIFADGADREGILRLYKNPIVKGFTTNPTLMKKAGIADYKEFSKSILSDIKDRPFSLEVFADDFYEMERQAAEIATWGENVYVKIPVSNTLGVSSVPLIKRLADKRIRLNVTALMTLEQVEEVSKSLVGSPHSYVSVFAGRIADTGRDPLPIMADAVKVLSKYSNLELIWASPRELLNIFHADSIGCHVITVTHDVLGKLNLVGKDLSEYSLDTVKMFFNDGQKAGYSL